MQAASAGDLKLVVAGTLAAGELIDVEVMAAGLVGEGAQGEFLGMVVPCGMPERMLIDPSCYEGEATE